MQLQEPSRLIFLWMVPLLALLVGWGRGEWNRRLNRLGKGKFIEKRLMPGFSLTERRWTWALLTAVFFLSSLALARPQWGEEKKKIERKGRDLIFLLDTSLSMLAEDIKPNRLGKSKLEIKNVIRRLKGDRVGMVAFAGSSFLQCPLTLDYSAFLLFVDALKPGFIPDPGTSLSQAIELGVRAFPEESRKYRAMILFSDGEHHEGEMSQALEFAKKAGIRIYAVGVGTSEGEPIPLRSVSEGKPVSGYKKDRQGNVVITRLNPELLTQVTQETGGLYLPATAAEKEVDVILRHLETLGERQLKERLIAEREDHFQLFLFFAFLLLAGESLVGNFRRRAPQGALALLALFCFTGFLDSPRSLVEKGNRQVTEKKYQSAVENYRKAEVAKPNDAVVRYNLGTALYHLYEYRDAEQELEQAVARAKDPGAKAKAYYNHGNTKYRLGDFDQAIEAYKKALDLNPKDENAKYNLEFLQKKKSQFEKQNQERQKEQKEKPQPQSQQQDEQQSEQQREQQEQQEQREREQQQQQEQEQKQAQAGAQQQEEQPQPQMGPQSQEGGQGEQESEPKPDTGEEQEQKKSEGEETPKAKPEEGGEKEKESQLKEGPSQGRILQGQMTQESALRILDALRNTEKQLQDLRRPPLQPGSREVDKDW